MSSLRKYWCVFRIRFNAGLQYRAAAWGGIVTQFFWGFLNILLFVAFYQANPSAFPMSLRAVSAYVWLRQAFFSLFCSTRFDGSLFEAITSGSVAYELVRPIDLYDLWYTKNLAMRFSDAVLRMAPILVIALLLPAPYGLILPPTPLAFVVTLLSVILATLVITATSMFVYILTFYTMQPRGLRGIYFSIVDFFSGSLIPLPFFPDSFRVILDLTPFATIMDIPLRIYSGDIPGTELLQKLFLQVFWLIVMVLLGKLLMRRALRRTVIQGG